MVHETALSLYCHPESFRKYFNKVLGWCIVPPESITNNKQNPNPLPHGQATSLLSVKSSRHKACNNPWGSPVQCNIVAATSVVCNSCKRNRRAFLLASLSTPITLSMSSWQSTVQWYICIWLLPEFPVTARVTFLILMINGSL